MHNNGKNYEHFVATVFQSIVDAQQIGGYNNITLQRNVHLVGNSGVKREFDIFWEYELAGFRYSSVIECKDYASPISIEKIDAILGKVKDFPNLRPILASRNGFQEGAEKYASQSGVELLIVRDENPETDWIAPDGTPLIRNIIVDIHCMIPWSLDSFKPEIDHEWAKAHNISRIFFHAPLDEVLLYTKSNAKPISIKALVDKEDKIDGDRTGLREFSQNLGSDAFLEANGQKIKINGFKIAFRPSYTLEEKLQIAPTVLGVVEYINQKQKKMVLNQGGQTIIKSITL